MQLLNYGADVHNPGRIIRQTPLRVAVCDLNMDCDLVELLVSRGASPFLEDPDGQSALENYHHAKHTAKHLLSICCMVLLIWHTSKHILLLTKQHATAAIY